MKGKLNANSYLTNFIEKPIWYKRTNNMDPQQADGVAQYWNVKRTPTSNNKIANGKHQSYSSALAVLFFFLHNEHTNTNNKSMWKSCHWLGSHTVVVLWSSLDTFSIFRSPPPRNAVGERKENCRQEKRGARGKTDWPFRFDVSVSDGIFKLPLL